MFSLKEKEVNTGRQRELDLVKGFLMIMIVFIHSFQTIAGAAAAESSVHKIMFALFMPTGACLYLFTMGFGRCFYTSFPAKGHGQKRYKTVDLPRHKQFVLCGSHDGQLRHKKFHYRGSGRQQGSI